MKRTPKPCIKFENQVSDWVQPPLQNQFSGELTATTGRRPMGMARFPGLVGNVAISARMGREAGANVLSVAAQVYINGVAVCTTAPKLAYVSGEAAGYKTTQGLAADASGKTIAVVGSSNVVAAGDTLECVFTVVRTASPVTEISSVSAIVEITPVLP